MANLVEAQYEFTLGRGDVKLPVIQPDGERALGVGQFFSRLWQLNGFGEMDKYGAYDLTGALGKEPELVIPAAGNQPLVNIRGRYTRTSELERAVEKARRRGWDDRSITMGVEREAILLAPTNGNAWYPLLTYTDSHQGEGSLSSDPSWSIKWHGNRVSRWEVQDELPRGKNERPVRYNERVDKAFQERVKALLTETVELLS